jgi:Zn-dependent peptidase ImmA (M78 family)
MRQDSAVTTESPSGLAGLHSSVLAVLQELNVKLRPDASGVVFAAYINDDIQPNVIYDRRLNSPELRSRFLVHELCHVYLHPPRVVARGGCAEEEPIVYEAAARICAEFGVNDYTSVMRDYGIELCPTEAHQEDAIRRIVIDVSAVLRDPARALLWVDDGLTVEHD